MYIYIYIYIHTHTHTCTLIRVCLDYITGLQPLFDQDFGGRDPRVLELGVLGGFADSVGWPAVQRNVKNRMLF